MTTIEKVVKKWDADYASNIKNAENLKMTTETLTGKNLTADGKIQRGSFYGRLGEEAVIKLSGAYPCEPWHNRTCYVFGCNYDETEKPIKIEISFQRRIKKASNTQAFYEFLNEKFGKKFILSKGRINPNHLVLKRIFSLDSSTEDICDGMKELINSTQEDICKFLKGEYKEEPPTEEDEKRSTEREEELFTEKLLMEYEKELFKESVKEIFSEITEKYKIKEDGEVYNKCKKIYIITLIILDNLHIGSEEADKFLKLSYYTKKSIAQKLFTASNDKLGEFRLYYTYGMNDPHEGKTLLSFLGIKDENSKLPDTLPFIACFSLEVNSLNQFRLYGNDGNKEANGVSVVFDFDFFSDDINKKDGKYQLYHCVYIDPDNGKVESISFSRKDEKENYEKIENRRKEMEDLFIYLRNKTQELLDIKDIKDIDKHELAEDLLINIRYLVKDYAFMEERECRIIDMRSKKSGSITTYGERLYIEIGAVKNYISEIYFAPLTEGIEVFEIETGIKCIRSHHPYKSKVVEK